MKKLIQKLMTKWKITSMWDFTAIMLVFSLAGMFVVRIRKSVFVLIGIKHETPFLIKFICWLLVIFPTYQIGLLIFGFLLGQFTFFWEKEKKMLQAIKRLFSPQKTT
ncbi:MAG: hypothetical protein KBD53_00145 [Candidatus Omnitrophica bacterium]|nr:hypothetical protein [Candidatus Omnitrophota bacterium]